MPLAVVLILATALAVAPRLVAIGFQQPTFRAAVDLLTLDVQVVDDEGRPVTTLGADQFEVTIDKTPRRVVATELVTLGRRGRLTPASARTADELATPASGRLIMLAINTGGLTLTAARQLAQAAATFVDQLADADQVGVYAYPVGPKIRPTTDHGMIRRALDSVVGSWRPAGAGRPPIAFAADRSGRGDPWAPECDDDPTCDAPDMLGATATPSAASLTMRQGMAGLDALVQALGVYPGRKFVVMIGGEPDAAGRDRLDIAGLARQFGRDAATSRASVYVLQAGAAGRADPSAEHRGPDTGGPLPVGPHDWLGAFARAAGGVVLPVPTGWARTQFGRVLAETSAYYRLAVERSDRDRAGRSGTVAVRIRGTSGLTIRTQPTIVIARPAR